MKKTIIKVIDTLVTVFLAFMLAYTADVWLHAGSVLYTVLGVAALAIAVMESIEAGLMISNFAIWRTGLKRRK